MLDFPLMLCVGVKLPAIGRIHPKNNEFMIMVWRMRLHVTRNLMESLRCFDSHSGLDFFLRIGFTAA